MAWITASSVGVFRSRGAMTLSVRDGMYQVASTPAQLAPVEASWARDTVASVHPYSSCHQETWSAPR